MALERSQTLAVLNVPQYHLSVTARADNSIPLKPDSINRPFVTPQRAMQS